jgi:xanthine dehydrogenase accessory factor
MAKVWARIRETIERHGKAGLLSVVGAAGSVPRETGARIVLQPDGGFYGTIGGGRLEYEAIAAAFGRTWCRDLPRLAART